MKSTPLIINWHDNSAPIYSCHFEPNGKGRLATAGGDNNIRLWRLESDGEDRKVEYLSTLSKHTQSVNCVRFAPKGELLASAADDGNVLLWVPADVHHQQPAFGEDVLEDKETWRVKHMCRSSGEGIYDLAWSPDSVYFIIGSMDNVARIYNAQTGQFVRQIAEHSHYIQGVAWDPLNEYVATQSSDRSVHIYSLRTKDGQFTLDVNPIPKVASHAKLDFPSRRISSNSPAPPDFKIRQQSSTGSAMEGGSPGPSAPGTPTSLALPMDPPSAISHSRRSSFGSSPAMRRSASPAPSMPLPAVMPMEPSPRPYSSGVRNGNLYANETLTSFFRRLTFTPDGALLLTPAGQYQTEQVGLDGKKTYEVINTVYIYTRGGINKAPIAHLPGHKKPSVVVRCSPVLYATRPVTPATKHITIDTSDKDGPIPQLGEPAISPRTTSTSSIMEPPPLASHSSTEAGPTSTPKKLDLDTSADMPGPPIAFSLPYRIVYAVATQDSVLLYDTQQQTPLCVVSNLHFATFTDLTWSSDGQTLLMTSSDGFCSTLTFSPEDLGTPHVVDPLVPKHLTSASLSSQNTPVPTPTSVFAPPSPFHNSHHRTSSNHSVHGITAPSPPPSTPVAGFVSANDRASVGSSSNPPSFFAARPSSPTRSNSTSSIATQASLAHHAQPGTVISNPPLLSGSIPSVAQSATGTSLTSATQLPGMSGSGFGHGTGKDMATPPQTPRSTASSVSGVGMKRDGEKADLTASESERDDGKKQKRRRIAPTPVERP